MGMIDYNCSVAYMKHIRVFVTFNRLMCDIRQIGLIV